MTLAPRFLINFWAGYRVAKFNRRLKSAGDGVGVQDGIFDALMEQFGNTEFGRGHGLAAGTSYGHFRQGIPPRTYAYFEPLVRRMIAGEPGVLSKARCRYFVETSGTTGDHPKIIPAPEPMLKHYRRALSDTLFLHASRVRSTGVFLGRHLHIGESTALREASGSFGTTLDGILTLSLPRWAEANLRSPPLALANLPKSAEKTEAVARCMIGRNVTLVAGTPASVYALSLAAREAASSGKRRMTSLRALWPNLECFLHMGAPLGLYSEVMREALGPNVNFHELYAAAEGIIAAQDEGPAGGLRLLTDAGIFFEFLPLRDFHEETLANAGTFCVPLGKVETGVDYVLLLTTPAGLCRYVPGDIVRFLSMNPPRLHVVGRTQLHLNAFGERVTERELLETLLAVCQRNGWQPVSFHVAPYHHRAAAGRVLSCHEWWLELRTHSMKTPTANAIAPELDAELSRRNPDYAAKRATHVLDQATVRLLIPGIFEQWAQEQSKATGAVKLPHCRSDRLIADQLTQFTRFHQVLPADFDATDPNTRMPGRSAPDVIG